MAFDMLAARFGVAPDVGTLPLVPAADADQPSRRVYLGVPDDYYVLSEAEQDEVVGQMADTFIAELGPDDGGDSPAHE